MADEVTTPVEVGISDEDFQKLAASPKNVRGDEGSVTERGMQDLIDADRYLLGKEAAKKGYPFGIGLSSIVYDRTV